MMMIIIIIIIIIISIEINKNAMGAIEMFLCNISSHLS